MSNTKVQQVEDYTKMFEQGYNTIVQNGNYHSSDKQWLKQGDKFEMFTLYNDTTPVVASSSTTIILK